MYAVTYREAAAFAPTQHSAPCTQPAAPRNQPAPLCIQPAAAYIQPTALCSQLPCASSAAGGIEERLEVARASLVASAPVAALTLALALVLAQPYP